MGSIVKPTVPGTPVAAVPEPLTTLSHGVFTTVVVNGTEAPSEAFTAKEPLLMPSTPPCGSANWLPEGPSEIVAAPEMNRVTAAVAFPPELATVIVPR